MRIHSTNTGPSCPKQGQLAKPIWTNDPSLQVLHLGCLPHQPCGVNIPDIPDLVPRFQLPKSLWDCVITPAGREDPEEAAPWAGHGLGTPVLLVGDFHNVVKKLFWSLAFKKKITESLGLENISKILKSSF